MRLPAVILVFFLGLQAAKSQDLLSISNWRVKGNLLSYNDSLAFFETDDGLRLQLVNGYRLKVNRDKRTTPMGSNADFPDTIYVITQAEPSPPGLSGRSIQGQINLGWVVPSEKGLRGPAVSAMINYRFNPWLVSGIGAGFEDYPDVRLFPFTASVSGVISKQRVSPYYDLTFGHAFAKSQQEPAGDWEITPKAEGGFRFSPSIGIKIQDRISTVFTFGFIRQKLTTITGFYDWMGGVIKTTQERKMNLYTFRMGFIF